MEDAVYNVACDRSAVNVTKGGHSVFNIQTGNILRKAVVQCVYGIIKCCFGSQKSERQKAFELLKEATFVWPFF